MKIDKLREYIFKGKCHFVTMKQMKQMRRAAERSEKAMARINELQPATESEVVYHGPALDAEGGALEMKLITPKLPGSVQMFDPKATEHIRELLNEADEVAEAQRLMGGI